MKTIQVRLRLFSVLFSVLLGFSSVGLAATVKSCDEPSLRAALAEGGTVTFACDGTITLTSTLVIGADTTIDTSGHHVTLSGGNAVRIFEVLSNVSLCLNNLTLAHGRAAGAEGAAGQGGAVRVQGGTLCAAGCTFATNNAVGGKGPQIFGLTVSGALGEGGAVYAAFAVLRLTNCVFVRNTATGGAGSDAPPGFPQAFGGDGGSSRGGSISAFSSQLILAGGMLSNNAANVGAIGAGFWSGNLVDTWGGALYGADCTCAGDRLTWRGNVASIGGACFLERGAAGFASCVFQGNSAGGPQAQGGAILTRNAPLVLVDCLLRNNAAQGSGAFLIRAVPHLGGSASGGAVSSGGGDLRITNCAFAGNLAQGGDGALIGPPFFVLPAGSAGGGGLAHSGTGVVVNCTFASNSARSGRAVSPDGSGARGGGLASAGGLVVQFSTIASNVVSDNLTTSVNSQGAGCYVAGAPFLLASSILSGNFATTGGSIGVPANASGPVTDGGHNLSSDATPTSTDEASRNNTDPLLGPLADNGGPTPTMALRPASPAINAADSASCPPTDQRGVVRPQLGECDIGAFELPDAFYILALQSAGHDSFHLSGLGIPNQGFRVEFSGSLSNWMDAASGFTGPDGLFSVEVDRGLQQQRFYRIAVP